MGGLPGKVEGQVLGKQRWFDVFQSRHWWVGFPMAVLKKYSDDQASRQAALLTYYGFLSMFPLALIFVAVLSALLRNDPQRVDEILDQLVAPQYQQTVLDAYNSLPPSGLPLVIGLVGLLLSGMGVAFAAYMALNQFFAVPYRQRFGIGPRYLRVFAALFLVGLGVLLVASLSILAGSLSGLPWIQRLAIIAGTSLIAFFGIYLVARLLTARSLGWSELWLGCLLGGVSTAVVFALSAPLLTYLTQRSSAVYGVFATVVGILAIIYVAAQCFVISLEVSVVRAWHLWPRGIDINLLFDADRRAYRLLTQMDERMPSAMNTAVFTASGNDDPLRASMTTYTERSATQPRSPHHTPAGVLPLDLPAQAQPEPQPEPGPGDDAGQGSVSDRG
jgi:membrane protein